uniref:Uncharacterized protein n=1 Tax=Anguilla anguilla TaxID=7936 RepID=A0A0E9XR57_ANGAN
MTFICCLVANFTATSYILACKSLCFYHWQIIEL